MVDPIPMPGSFQPDLDQPLRPTLTKSRPSLYIPPQSPSAASSLSKSSLPPLIPHPNNGGRKRARYDCSDSTITNQRQISQDDDTPDQTWTASISSFDSLQSPSPLVSTKYRLAGGWDTPAAAGASTFADDHDSAVIDYRPNRFLSQTLPVAASHFLCTPGVLGRERNGRKRGLSPPPQQQHGWGRTVCNIVGGVAGKVFNFCWAGAFRGFHAGGGRGYTLDISTPLVIDESTCLDIKKEEDVFNQSYERQCCPTGTAIPGGFPAENFIEDYMTRPQFCQASDVSTPSRTREEKTCGRQQSRETWVIVRSIDGDSRETSPTRKIPRTSTLNSSRPAPRGSAIIRPRLAPSRPCRSSFAGSGSLVAAQPASFASPRRQIETSNALTRPHTSEGRRHRSQSSLASPRRPERVRTSETTQITPDAQKFERKFRQKERAQQDSIERLSQQTKNMIREAKEALGTRIDIEDEAQMEDEGYEEGAELMTESKW